MEKEIASIMELKVIRKQKSILCKREQELSTAVLHDVSLIPEIYSWFNDISHGKDVRPCQNGVMHRKKFLFVILFLFAPSALAGGRLPHRLRSEIAHVFPNVAPCVISSNIADIPFMYQQYKEFRQDIGCLYTEIVNQLRIKGLINQEAGV